MGYVWFPIVVWLFRSYNRKRSCWGNGLYGFWGKGPYAGRPWRMGRYNFKVFLHLEIDFKHKSFEVDFGIEDTEMIQNYRDEAKRAYDKMEEEDEEEDKQEKGESSKTKLSQTEVTDM